MRLLVPRRRSTYAPFPKVLRYVRGKQEKKMRGAAARASPPRQRGGRVPGESASRAIVGLFICICICIEARGAGFALALVCRLAVGCLLGALLLYCVYKPFFVPLFCVLRRTNRGTCVIGRAIGRCAPILLLVCLVIYLLW